MNRKMTIDSLDAKETMQNKTEIERAEAYLAAEIRNKQDKTRRVTDVTFKGD